jgi:flavin-dependent dehydrogenase
VEEVDLFIAGGGIGGSVTAKFAAMGGLDVLFVERCETPRHKPCSGIQFPYFERILGEEIPRERLCNVQIERTEEYTSTIDTSSPERVWLGQDRMLMVGDAAGLLDGVRGVGQDAAALSGRLAARAILHADEKGTRAIDEYGVLARRITQQTRRNQARAIGQFRTNEELQRHLKRGMLKTGILMGIHGLLNRYRSPERIKLLPP